MYQIDQFADLTIECFQGRHRLSQPDITSLVSIPCLVAGSNIFIVFRVFTLEILTLEKETPNDLNQDNLVPIFTELLQEVVVALKLKNDASHGVA